MSDIVERLRDVAGFIEQEYGRVASAACLATEAAAEIERLRAALREIAKHPRGGVIDTPEKMDRDEFIGIARAALEGK